MRRVLHHAAGDPDRISETLYARDRSAPLVMIHDRCVKRDDARGVRKAPVADARHGFIVLAGGNPGLDGVKRIAAIAQNAPRGLGGGETEAPGGDDDGIRGKHR